MAETTPEIINQPTVTPTTPTTPTTPAAAAPTTAPTAAPDSIAAAVIAAVEARSTRAEKSVIKSMAEQYGMTEDEMSKVLAAEKQKRDNQLPPAVQQQISAAVEKANGLLISADVRAKGAAMGMVDADAALLMMAKDGIKVTDAGDVTGVQEALDALKTAKPYLFGTTAPQPTGAVAQVGAQITTTPTDDGDAKLRRIMGLPPKKKE